MIQSYSIKDLPAPLRSLIRPMLLISLGLHGLILLIPMEADKKPAAPAKDEKTVKVTQLAPLSKAPPNQPSPKATAKPAVKPAIAPAVRPIVQSQSTIPAPRRPVVNNQPQPQTTAPSPAAPSPAAPSPALSPATSSSVSETSATPAPTAPTPETSAPVDDLSALFYFPGAKPGCLGVQACFATGQSLDAVAAYFEKELPNRGAKVSPEASSPAGTKIYLVNKEGLEPKYLSLITVEQDAVYVVADEPRTLADLQKAVEVPREFNEAILAGLAPAEVTGSEEDFAQETSVSSDDFANPEFFYPNPNATDEDGFFIEPDPNSAIDSFKKVLGQAPQQLFDSFFAPQLQGAGYAVTPIAAGYGGGLLYQVQKGSSKPFYLNLVPTADSSGTIVVTWLKQPV